MTLVGRQIGRYRILEQLGQGGMSVVYKGLDTALDREVAVKVLHAHLAGKEESRRRLTREAKAVARLNHPNILEVYDFAAEDTEQAYIVTEYIRGQTLRQYADAGGFEPPEIAAMVIHEIAAALAQAHEAGIIHRDLKPENVMVREDGVIKLMDFGIAKIIDRDDRMTMTGALVGSPAHMAPEIIEGEEAGPEADVFSLGTMLFFFATGRLPFAAANTTATLKRILDGTYDDPRQLVPTVSDELAEIIATCLARQPTSRYPDAVRLRDALHDYLLPLGLGRTTEELCHFFADPAAYRKALTPRLSAALLAKAEGFLEQKRPAKALSAINHLLALDPQNARATGLLGAMNAAKKRQRRSAAFKRAGIALGALAVLGAGVGALTGRATERTEDFVPPPDPVTEVQIAARAYPAQRPANPVEPAPPPSPALQAPRPESTATPREVRPASKVTRPRLEAIKPAPALVPVVLKFRPYGFFSIDGGPRSDRELGQHTVQLPEGDHTLTYGCSFCEPVTTTIHVSATRREFHNVVMPTPAQLHFDVRPREAMIQVLGRQYSATELATRPLVVRSPSSAAEVRHEVRYEVHLPGYKGVQRTLKLNPGEQKQIQILLEPE